MGKKTTKSSSRNQQPSQWANWKIIAALAGVFFVYLFYQVFIASNVRISTDKYCVYISPRSKAGEIGSELADKEIISSGLSFRILAYFRGFKTCKSGLYEVDNGWNNWQLISHLKNDRPKKARAIEIPELRNRNKLFPYLSQSYKLRADSLRKLCRDTLFLHSFSNLGRSSVYCMFLPGVYYMEEGLSEREFIKRMYAEYQFFWNEERLTKAKELELTPEEVGVLASIVYSETKNQEEMPVIAGVYLNRLEKDMKLESDPTVIYANGIYEAKRVYEKHKQKNSPYNTYKVKGLPPGPIYITPKGVIDATLNYASHDYIFFCAKSDSSGCHSFASSYEEHKKNAEDYHNFLDQRRVK